MTINRILAEGILGIEAADPRREAEPPTRKGRSGRAIRRRPTQLRARQTVEAILDAVLRVLKREGAGAITTNRIAEVAGVSIGSLYQYFPDKQAIFAALHARHLEQIDRTIQTALIEHATSLIEDLIRALIDAMVDAHSTSPEFHEFLSTQVPHRKDGSLDFAPRLHGAFLIAFSARANELRFGEDLDAVVFDVGHMIDALSHGAALRRPANLSLESAKAEAVSAILAYLRSAEPAARYASILKPW